MFIKLIWTSIMFVTIIGGLMFAWFGIPVPESYYEESDVFVATDEN